jgi:hypothetical protein
MDPKLCWVEVGRAHVTGVWPGPYQLPISVAQNRPSFLSSEAWEITLSSQQKLILQNEKVVVIGPLILLRGTPEEVNGGKCKAMGGLFFLEVDMADVIHCLVPYTLTFWVPRR